MQLKRETKSLTPQAQLRALIERLDPQAQKLMRLVRTAIRKRFPTANELVYDYRTSLVVGYSPTDRGIESIVALAARPDGVRLYFHGTRLPDPKKLLLGSGKATRFIRLESARQLSDPDVKAFIAAAIDQAKIPFPSSGKGEVILRSAAAEKQARRRSTK